MAICVPRCPPLLSEESWGQANRHWGQLLQRELLQVIMELVCSQVCVPGGTNPREGFLGRPCHPRVSGGTVSSPT